jgi:hypothetical protein
MSLQKKSTRREFLVAGSSAALAAATSAANEKNQTSASQGVPVTAAPYDSRDLLAQTAGRTFRGENATQVAMPLGGIGAGSICLNGYGGLQDFAIRTRPETTALPTGFSSNSP